MSFQEAFCVSPKNNSPRIHLLIFKVESSPPAPEKMIIEFCGTCESFPLKIEKVVIVMLKFVFVCSITTGNNDTSKACGASLSVLSDRSGWKQQKADFPSRSLFEDEAHEAF